MKVIGAGLPRTATLSQKVALEMVGFGPCYHMVNVLGDLSLVPTWRDALDGKADFREVFAGYNATVDWPGSFFYAELMEVFPDAKVFLSKRDGEAWERSMRDTIWALFWGDDIIYDMSRARSRVDPDWAAYCEMMLDMWGRIGINENSQPGDLAEIIERYQDEVIATVPSERLLVWSVGDGWKPLCEFLEIEPPEAPFPRLNDSAQFGERIIDGALLAIKQWRDGATQEVLVPAH